MKVGILTFHHTTNYGATLQAYALWTTIKRYGHDVEIIDYRPYVGVKFYIEKILYRDDSVNPYWIPELVKAFKMRRFLLSKMDLSKRKAYRRAGLKNFDGQYDVVICGSDQVWCFNSFRGFNPSFFLDFVGRETKCLKISYAPSFNTIDSLGKYRDLISKLLSDFDAISVRDSHSLQVLRQECNIEAARVLDPTFLIEYTGILSVPKLKDEYLLVYVEPLNLEQEEIVKSIAERQNLVIISVGNYIQVADKNLIGISPEEWLGYFSRASYIVTNTYHGTIFSIIFRKMFTVFAKEGKGNKTNDLLRLLGLETRLLSEGELGSWQEHFAPIDYKAVCNKLEKEISRSKTYLSEALEGRSIYPQAVE
jgi:polysaccharide pyruvyl transferase WcaK-like protein